MEGSVGLGAIVARSDVVFSALKLIGAGYLVLLGVRNIRNRKALTALFARSAGATSKPISQVVREGFLVGVANLPVVLDRLQALSEAGLE